MFQKIIFNVCIFFTVKLPIYRSKEIWKTIYKIKTFAVYMLLSVILQINLLVLNCIWKTWELFLPGWALWQPCAPHHTPACSNYTKFETSSHKFIILYHSVSAMSVPNTNLISSSKKCWFKRNSTWLSSLI